MAHLIELITRHHGGGETDGSQDYETVVAIVIDGHPRWDIPQDSDVRVHHAAGTGIGEVTFTVFSDRVRYVSEELSQLSKLTAVDSEAPADTSEATVVDKIAEATAQRVIATVEAAASDPNGTPAVEDAGAAAAVEGWAREKPLAEPGPEAARPSPVPEYGKQKDKPKHRRSIGEVVSDQEKKR